MKRLHSFIRLPATQRSLLIRAALLLWATRLGNGYEPPERDQLNCGNESWLTPKCAT
jgi:hypothetical protein